MRPKALLALLDCSGIRIAELGRPSSSLPGVKLGICPTAGLRKPRPGTLLEVARSAPPAGRFRVDSPSRRRDRATVACLKSSDDRDASVPDT